MGSAKAGWRFSRKPAIPSFPSAPARADAIAPTHRQHRPTVGLNGAADRDARSDRKDALGKDEVDTADPAGDVQRPLRAVSGKHDTHHADGRRARPGRRGQDEHQAGGARRQEGRDARRTHLTNDRRPPPPPRQASDESRRA